MSEKWFQKASCKQHAACVACRTVRSFRESLHRAGLVDSPEFKCVDGFTEYDLPEPIVVKSQPKAKGCCK